MTLASKASPALRAVVGILLVLVTVDASGGTIPPDASPLFQGLQVQASSSGDFSFESQRPASDEDIDICADQTNGARQSMLIQDYTPVSVICGDVHKPPFFLSWACVAWSQANGLDSSSLNPDSGTNIARFSSEENVGNTRE